MMVNDSNQSLSRPQDTGIVLNTKRIIENSPLIEKTASLHSLGIFLYLRYISWCLLVILLSWQKQKVLSILLSQIYPIQ